MSPQNIPPNLVQNPLGNQKKFQKTFVATSVKFFLKKHIYFFQFWDIQNLVNVSQKNIQQNLSNFTLPTRTKFSQTLVPKKDKNLLKLKIYTGLQYSILVLVYLAQRMYQNTGMSTVQYFYWYRWFEPECRLQV